MKPKLVQFVVLMWSIGLARCRSVPDDENDCEPLSESMLNDILGSAFNPRYMKLEEPVFEDVFAGANGKRATSSADPDFYVDDELSVELSDEPAWAVKFSQPRIRRQARPMAVRKDPWHCEMKIKWVDLGRDYYPRYLRTVECTRQNCWYGKYTCKPKSFSIKILKRRKGVCAPLNSEPLKEVWVWEERAVNFCCDCVMARNSYY